MSAPDDLIGNRLTRRYSMTADQHRELSARLTAAGEPLRGREAVLMFIARALDGYGITWPNPSFPACDELASLSELEASLVLTELHRFMNGDRI